MPNTQIEANVKSESTKRSDLPTSIWVYFLTIMAMISVPPELAAMLNKIADPTELIMRVKNSSSMVLSVRVPLIGIILSKARAARELRIAT